MILRPVKGGVRAGDFVVLPGDSPCKAVAALGARVDQVLEQVETNSHQLHQLFQIVDKDKQALREQCQELIEQNAIRERLTVVADGIGDLYFHILLELKRSPFYATCIHTWEDVACFLQPLYDPSLGNDKDKADAEVLQEEIYKIAEEKFHLSREQWQELVNTKTARNRAFHSRLPACCIIKALEEFSVGAPVQAGTGNSASLEYVAKLVAGALRDAMGKHAECAHNRGSAVGQRCLPRAASSPPCL
eukprot:TRINITY_DN17196_c0_g1_i1.p1 TRINITY_DN17196_c0_g1~~TRINITY_DN17196_c0_g1_i1.p1  ORF type:complete len:247 (-),score=44.07 TRINITY_DN17196_c0_g1_i1:151-891(-)